MSVVVVASGVPTADVMDDAVSAARALGVPVVVVGTGPSAVKGADRTFAVTGLDPFSADRWTDTLAALLPSLGATLVMTADSAHARAFVPRVASRIAMPLLSGATRVLVRRADRLEVERPLHGGLQSERLVVAPPLFVTVLASTRTPAETTSAPGEAFAAQGESRDVVVRVIPPNAATVDIRNADRIVAGGLGLGTEASVALLGRLAKPLRAAVGGTRVISDRGWLEHERYIGSTGKMVAPKLYLALGISGASQHVVGITESEAIIAVNTDRAAPIFGVADLGIVGDLHAIVPELEKRLAKELE